MSKVFVITPAYNAGRTLESVFDRFPPSVADGIHRFVVVDDGSTDDTGPVLARLARTLPNLVPLKHESNRGYGAAEKTLLRYCLDEGADIAVMVHADGQYSPECLPEILAAFDRDAVGVVQGSRMLGGGALKGGMPLYKYVCNRALTAVENLAFGMRMAEYHSGYMSYARAFLEAVPFEHLSDSFDFDLEMLVAAKVLGFRIAEVAVPTIYADEVSYLNPIKYGLDVLRVVGRYRRGRFHEMLEVAGPGAEETS